jgi:hypothetical protein
MEEVEASACEDGDGVLGQRGVGAGAGVRRRNENILLARSKV